jgi:hypothetical protein
VVLCELAFDVRMLLTDIFDGEDPSDQPWKQLKLMGTRPNSARPFGSGSPRNFLWNVAAGSKLLPGGSIGTPQGVEALELDSHLERMQLEREERQVHQHQPITDIYDLAVFPSACVCFAPPLQGSPLTLLFLFLSYLRFVMHAATNCSARGDEQKGRRRNQD